MPFPGHSPENPYIGLLYEHLAAAGVELTPDDNFWRRSFRREVPDFVHYHWPGRRYNSRTHAVFTPAVAARFFLRLDLMRKLGAQIVWTMHNELPHDEPWIAFNRRARARLVATSDIILTNFDAARDLLREHYGRTDRVYTIPHGSYRGAYPDTISREEARVRLGLGPDDFVFLAFGDMRAYKNLLDVVAAFRNLTATHARLLLAGRPKASGLDRAVQSAVGADSRVIVHAKDVPSAEVQTYFRAADVFVIGRRVFTSGSAVLALDFDLPIVGYPVNHLAEVASGNALIPIAGDGVEALSNAMHAAMRVDGVAARQAAHEASLAIAWPPIAERLASVLRANLHR